MHIHQGSMHMPGQVPCVPAVYNPVSWLVVYLGSMWQPKEHTQKSTHKFLPAVRSYVILCICCVNPVILI
jgi:hypothetical protein